MKYPTIRAASAQHIANSRLENRHVDLADFITAKTTPDGDESELDVSECAALGKVMADAVAKTEPTAAEKDRLEGSFSAAVFRTTSALPIEVIDDPAFWAYLSIEFFFEFIAWRENLSTEGGPKYYDGRSTTECVPLRMFHRGRLVMPDEQLATAIPRATDFWRSHIIRVQTGTSPELTQAFARSHAEDRMNTNELRQFAKLINRLWTNVSLDSYSLEESQELIVEHRNELEASTE